MITIKYKDKNSWTGTSGEVINWDRYAETHKEGRILPAFLAPVIVTENWGGKVYEIQHVIWDAYVLEFWIKESELHHISKMQSCSDIIFQDENIRHELKDIEAEQIIIDEPERVEGTSNFAIKITYKTNKTVINKQRIELDSLGQAAHTLHLEYSWRGTNNQTMYAKTNMPALKDVLEPEMTYYKNDTGVETKAKTITREVSKLCFYYTHDEAMRFVNFLANAQYMTLDTHHFEDYEEAEVTEVGDDLVRVVLKVITKTEVFYNEYEKP